jgi:periplasmic divalent cation tolerance protein
MSEEIIVFVSCPQSLAEHIAKELVEQKIAACVSIIPQIISVYIWQDKVCHETEYLLLIKSNLKRFDDLERRIKELHSYDVPEIIAVPIKAGNKIYLDWLNNSVSQKA